MVRRKIFRRMPLQDVGTRKCSICISLTNIINFIQAMDHVVPGFASYETLLYSPELKFYSNRIKMDTDFNTSVEGLHCLGDSSGWTRGLMMASVMGVIMGRKLL